MPSKQINLSLEPEELKALHKYLQAMLMYSTNSSTVLDEARAKIAWAYTKAFPPKVIK